MQYVSTVIACVIIIAFIILSILLYDRWTMQDVHSNTGVTTAAKQAIEQEAEMNKELGESTTFSILNPSSVIEYAPSKLDFSKGLKTLINRTVPVPDSEELSQKQKIGSNFVYESIYSYHYSKAKKLQKTLDDFGVIYTLRKMNNGRYSFVITYEHDGQKLPLSDHELFGIPVFLAIRPFATLPATSRTTQN